MPLPPSRTVSQVVTHRAELTDLGPFSLVAFAHAGGPFGPARLVATDDWRDVRGEDDLVDALGALPWYTLNTGAVADVFTTRSLESSIHLFEDDGDVTDAVTTLLDARGEQELRPTDAVRFQSYDHSLWPLPSVSTDPLTHVRHVEGSHGLTSDHFDIERARAILDAHPWVRYVQVRPGYEGGRTIDCDVLVPQDVFLLFVDASRQRSTGHPVQLGRISFDYDVLYPLLEEEAGTPARHTLSDGTTLDVDLLGLRPALLPHDQRGLRD